MTRWLEALRLLLGTTMVVTAVQYFLPFLLPFLPAAEWNDAMAQRLMTAFDRSGLLAVAKFIHLAAGAIRQRRSVCSIADCSRSPSLSTWQPERCCWPIAPCRSRSRR